MYTDVIRIQQPHRRSTSVHQLRHNGHYNPSPDLSSQSMAHLETLYRMQNASFRQRLQQPQQYAPHPLPSSVPIQTSNQNFGNPNANDAEHMLRRKTPNGTLAAGYDGRSTEIAAKPHAAKHILMVATNAADCPNYPWASSTDQHLVAPFGEDCSTQARHDQHHQYHGTTIHPVHGHIHARSRDKPQEAACDRRSLHYCGTGMDSLLNQGHTLQQNQLYGHVHQIPTVLQPMWPPCLGFTSMNHNGLYGPYWPDGAFEPYRPAALRDPRYDHSLPGGPSDPVLSLGPGRTNTKDLSLECPANQGFHPRELPNTYEPDQRYVSPLAFQAKSTSTSAERHAYRRPHQTRASCQAEIPNHGNDGGFSNDLEGFDSTLAPDAPDGKLYDVEYHSGNVQFKERILAWAHRIYVSLVASIHQSRRNGSIGSFRGEWQPPSSIYPNPPGQPFIPPASASDPDSQWEHRNAVRFSHTNDAGASQGFDSSTSFHSRKSVQTNDPFCYQPHSLWHRRSDRNWHNGKQQSQTAHPTRRQVHGFHNVLGDPISSHLQHDAAAPTTAALSALEILGRLCHESGWQWTDGMLLGGCLAYGLGDHDRAMKWYSKVLANVEALSNLAATFLSLNRREEAERHWRRSVALRPDYFEAVEHLVGLFCEDRRGREAVKTIEFVQQALRATPNATALGSSGYSVDSASEGSLSPETRFSERSDFEASDHDFYVDYKSIHLQHRRPVDGLSGYAISPHNNGRMLALIHGKGNMLYALGNNAGAAKSFEDAILIGSGQRRLGVRGLIRKILKVFADDASTPRLTAEASSTLDEPILLMPDEALETAKLVFPPHGQLPGLAEVTSGVPEKAAISIISNSLLSLAKIYQDGMSSSSATATGPRATSGVQDILALYYLSLSLQPSPSTANNVGILLASIQQAAASPRDGGMNNAGGSAVPGAVSGSGIALALAYYNYGLKLDSRHAHLYTNLGSLFKDIGQLDAAIKMYEKAVECDGKFDIALANLANAVKDRGKISDAISYYKKAVALNPEFAEAVCGLANALNSVCNWSGRGGVKFAGASRDRWHVDDQGMLYDARHTQVGNSGWIGRVVAIVNKQLREGECWGKGIISNLDVEHLLGPPDSPSSSRRTCHQEVTVVGRTLHAWAELPWEGAKLVRLIERATKRLTWQFYRNKYVHRKPSRIANYPRPQLPSSLAIPSAPTVLPFHTFTCPLTAKQIRRISQRNGLRISCSTLRAPWLPTCIYEAPAPPKPHLNVGYVSSDFNNHPLAHLMQSVFGFHDRQRVKAFCYATTASDGSIHRQQIEREAPVFEDVSSWSVDRLVKQIVSDGIHVLINLNGYTRGARNEVFAARPAPVQMSFMGFAGTLGAEWCDYLLADKIAIPSRTLRPNRRNVDLIDQTRDGNNDDDQEDWVYGENIIFARDTFFCCDHRQSAPDARGVPLSWQQEQKRRWKMRKELFPDIPDDTVILGNFNQLYKIEPTTFRTWLRILSRLPKAILWLLRFPDIGETNLRRTALLWVGSEVASRIVFTDVAPKSQHIARARVCDLFLDTPECNAHTTAADVLWSGTPLLTLPRYEYKMCSRIAASILTGALPKNSQGQRAARELIAKNNEEYEDRAVELGAGLVYPTETRVVGFGTGRLVELRKLLYESRGSSALFDTRRWVRDLEDAYDEAWHRWVDGRGGDIWL